MKRRAPVPPPGIIRRASRFARAALWSVVIGLLAGCAGQQLPPTVIPQARAALNEAAAPLRDVTPKLNRAGSLLQLACAPAGSGSAPLMPADACEVLIDAFNTGAAAIDKVQTALVTAGAALSVVEAVARESP